MRNFLGGAFKILVAACIVISFVVAGGTSLWVLLHDWNLYRASNTWPSVTGTVTESSLVEGQNDQEYAYTPKIIYRFVVGDYEYEGQQVQFDSAHGYRGFLSRSPADALLARYPVGSKVTVYYNPNNPGWDSVLERVYRLPGFWEVVLSVIALLALVLFAGVAANMALRLARGIYSKFINPIEPGA